MPDLRVYLDPALAAAQAATNAESDAYAAQLLAEQERRRQAEAELADLKARSIDLIPWSPGMVTEYGKAYRLPPGPVNCVVTQPFVTIEVGDGTYAAGESPAVNIKADDWTVRGGRFSKAGAESAGKFGIKPCIRVGDPTVKAGSTYPMYRRGRVVDVEFDRVDTGVECLPGCDGLVIDDCWGTDSMRSSGVYVGGGRRITILRSRFSSTNENTLRWSPQNGIVPEYGSVIDCDVQNIGGKAAVEFRHGRNLRVCDSRLSARLGTGSAVGIGDKEVDDGGAGATDVYVTNCDISEGNIRVHEGSDRITIDDVRVRWSAKPSDVFLYVSNGAGVVKDIRVTRVRGKSPVPQKAIIGWQKPTALPPLLVERDNGWEIE